MPTTAAQRDRILYRDAYACQCRGEYGCEHHHAETRCPAGIISRLLSAFATFVPLEVDHIKAEADGGSDDDANLQTLCKRCHEAKTSQENSRRRFSEAFRSIFSSHSLQR